MSMLTAQVERLRRMARLVRDYDKREMSLTLRDAADTIEGLREELHYQQTHWELDRCPNCGERLDAMALRDENAKLRALAMRFADYVGQDRCEGCVTKTRCNNGLMDECLLLTEIREIADGLGIEVER